MVANLGVKATAEPTVTPHQRPPAGGSGSPDAQATTIAKQHQRSDRGHALDGKSGEGGDSPTRFDLGVVVKHFDDVPDCPHILGMGAVGKFGWKGELPWKKPGT